MTIDSHSFSSHQFFAELYEDENSQRVVAQSAGISTSSIKFDGVAINNWTRILKKAYESNLLEHLIITVAKEYEARSAEVRLAQLHFLLTQAHPTPPGLVGVPLRTLCTHCVPSIYLESTSAINTLDHAIDYWAGLSFKTDPEKLAILKFAICVAQKIENNRRLVNHINQWVYDTGAHLLPNLDKVKIIDMINRVPTDEPQLAISYLYVVLGDDFDNPNRSADQERYRLGIQYGNQTWYDSDETYLLSKIPEKIREILDGQIEDNNKSVQIECFLPTRLLNTPVNLWKRKRTSERTFGELHPIALRALERFNGDYLNLCKKRIKGFKKQPNTYIHFVEQATCNFTDLSRKLDQNQCIIGMEFVFQPHDHEPARQLLDMLFDEGIPILLWSRQSSHQSSFKAQIQQMLQPEHLDDLPRLLQTIREQYANDDMHIGNHLSLLWDNPERIPTKIKLQLYLNR